MIRVVTATADDLEWIVSQLPKLDREFNEKMVFSGDKEGITLRMSLLIEDGVVLVAFDGDDRIGFIAGARIPHFFNPKIIVLSQFLWWVIPSRRGSRAAQKLLSSMVCVARETCDWMDVYVMRNCPIESESMRKFGFKEADKMFRLEVG